MRVEEVMTKDVKTCRREDTLEAAARLMWDNDCGCAPVVDDERHVVGMITDRDICMAASTRGKRLADVRVDSVMASKVHACSAKDALEAAESLMREHQIRRIPVEDVAGRLVGLVSLNDLARESRRTGAPSATEIAQTLAAVCRPRIEPPAVAPLRAAGASGAA